MVIGRLNDYPAKHTFSLYVFATVVLHEKLHLEGTCKVLDGGLAPEIFVHTGFGPHRGPNLTTASAFALNCLCACFFSNFAYLFDKCVVTRLGRVHHVEPYVVDDRKVFEQFFIAQ